MTTTTDQLNSYGKKYIANFVGVFPLIPSHINSYPAKFIVHSLPDEYTNGGHWNAVEIDENKRAKVFDSRGKYPDMPLINWLIRNTKSWTYNPHRYQQLFSLQCGQFCLYYLKYGIFGLKPYGNNEILVKRKISLQ